MAQPKEQIDPRVEAQKALRALSREHSQKDVLLTAAYHQSRALVQQMDVLMQGSNRFTSDELSDIRAARGLLNDAAAFLDRIVIDTGNENGRKRLMDLLEKGD